MADVDRPLEFRAVEPCRGRFGPARESAEYDPLDEVAVRFLIGGLSADDGGQVEIELATALFDGRGASTFGGRQRVRGLLLLGGDAVPGWARAELPTTAEPGGYTLKVSVRDLRDGRASAFEQPITLRPARLAIVALTFAHDEAGTAPAPWGGLVGQSLHFQLKVIGLDRAAGRVAARLDIEVLDADGSATIRRAPGSEVASDDPAVAARAEFVQFRGELPLNRPGRYLIRFAATDLVAGRTTTLDAPLVVTMP